jgi:hypothetical protein
MITAHTYGPDSRPTRCPLGTPRSARRAARRRPTATIRARSALAPAGGVLPPPQPGGTPPVKHQRSRPTTYTPATLHKPSCSRSRQRKAQPEHEFTAVPSRHEHAGLSGGGAGQPIHSVVGAANKGGHTVVRLPAALSNRNAVNAVMPNDTDHEVRIDDIARIVAAVTDPLYDRPVPPLPATAVVTSRTGRHLRSSPSSRLDLVFGSVRQRGPAPHNARLQRADAAFAPSQQPPIRIHDHRWSPDRLGNRCERYAR